MFLSNLTSVRCKFGSQVVSALNGNGTHLNCSVPSLNAGSYSVKVSNNFGRDWSTSLSFCPFVLVRVDIRILFCFIFSPNSSATLTIYEYSQVHSISPSFGPTSGGTSITIIGSFATTSNVKCVFGSTQIASTC